MEETKDDKLIIGSLKRYLEFIKKKYEENLSYLKLHDFEVERNEFYDYYNFKIRYEWNFDHKKDDNDKIKEVIEGVINDIYKFGRLMTLFPLEKKAHCGFYLDSVTDI